MPDEVEFLKELELLIQQGEMKFAGWLEKTSPANARVQVTQTGGDIFALQLLHNEIKTTRYEMIRQSILTRLAIRQLAAVVADKKAATEAPSPTATDPESSGKSRSQGGPSDELG